MFLQQINGNKIPLMNFHHVIPLLPMDYTSATVSPRTVLLPFFPPQVPPQGQSGSPSTDRPGRPQRQPRRKLSQPDLFGAEPRISIVSFPTMLVVSIRPLVRDYLLFLIGLSLLLDPIVFTEPSIAGARNLLLVKIPASPLKTATREHRMIEFKRSNRTIVSFVSAAVIRIDHFVLDFVGLVGGRRRRRRIEDAAEARYEPSDDRIDATPIKT
ncbi:hypothetical protein PMAYCL1PPCAC_05270 [Pristionchus mayeri]|uniref:Uncharacterized protein n=1 Tax=Pristionchus mayeri TaxID=1317129 RepID=A0AAN5C8Y0_9BILA|nr:hypothetical protein PMAYCL1PPCAC_05270 [Pristionchus mayeri]